MINKKLMAQFTEHMFKQNIRFLLLIRWKDEPRKGQLVYCVNGRSKDIRNDINEFIKEKLT